MLNGLEVSVWDEEKVLEMDGGDGGTTMRMNFMLLSKTVQMAKFMLCLFYYNKKNVWFSVVW